jgi:formylglycine-generating enzyme required for sulfatase activity
MGKDVVNSEKLDIPIVSITYNQCMEFIFRLNILTKLNFRLPTDTEWEYAARGGNKNKGYIYSGSDNIDDIAYFKDNSNHMIHTVKKKIPNELGLYDMSGNIFEICMDNPIDYMDRSEECYIDPILLYPDNADEFGKHIIRGGSWGTWEGMCRVDCLGCFLKNEEYDAASDWGFRLVLDEVYSLPNSFN